MNPFFHGSEQHHIDKISTSSGNNKNSQETLANSEISLILMTVSLSVWSSSFMGCRRSISIGYEPQSIWVTLLSMFD